MAVVAWVLALPLGLLPPDYEGKAESTATPESVNQPFPRKPEFGPAHAGPAACQCPGLVDTRPDPASPMVADKTSPTRAPAVKALNTAGEMCYFSVGQRPFLAAVPPLPPAWLAIRDGFCAFHNRRDDRLQNHGRP